MDCTILEETGNSKRNTSMKKALLPGASGATGQLLVKQLLEKNFHVTAIVRERKSFAAAINAHPDLKIIEAEISRIAAEDLNRHLAGCEAVLCCLGHNLTFTGLFGQTRRLVTDAITKTKTAIESLHPEKKIKIILMNATGNRNRDLSEAPPVSQRLVVFLLRILLPPHADNENAADFLRLQVGQTSNSIEWVVVRPDGLVDENAVSKYDIHPSPVGNVIFDARSTSRINVADFMSERVVNPDLWCQWNGQMPVIYNQP